MNETKNRRKVLEKFEMKKDKNLSKKILCNSYLNFMKKNTFRNYKIYE